MAKHAITLVLLLASLGGHAQNVRAQDKLDVVTTLPDLQSIAEAIGGDRVEVFSIATGYQNPHFVDPKPSYIRRLSRADVFVTVGLDLEIGWVPPLLTSSRNSNIQIGGSGYVDASAGVPLLEKPTSTSREQGDIHIYGNPHYWLDPLRGKIVADNILQALARLSPADRGYFQSNLERFSARVDSATAAWQERSAAWAGARVVAYHDQWPYFAERFGLDIAGFLEPKPGIPPTPSQLARTIRLMQNEGILVIVTSPYFKADAAELVANRVGGRVVTLATSVGATDEIRSYFDLFDHNISLLEEAFEQTGHHGSSSP